MTNDSVLIMEGEGGGSLRVEADGHERDESFFVGDAVVVTDREFAFAKLDVPLDAMEQFLERLHTAIVDWIALGFAAFGSGSSDETDRESP